MRRSRLYSYVRRAANTLLACADYLFPQARMRSRPLAIHIEYNDYCNARCIQCARENPDIPRNTGQWTLDMLERISPWLPSAGYVGIAGLGEPFISETLLDFLERIVQAGPAPSVITNGTLITPEKAERLAGMGPMLLNVSIDGATRETFEKIRVGADFDKVIENLIGLRAAKERKKTPFPIVEINWCLLQDNVQEMELLPALAERIGSQIINLQPAHDFGLPKAAQIHWVSDSEAEAAAQRLRQAAQPKGIRVVYTPLNSQWPIDDQAPEGKARCFCPNLWRFLHLDPRGNARVCCMGDFELTGNILENSLDDMWRARGMAAVRQALLRGDPPPCCRRCYLLRPYERRQAASHLKQYLETIRLGALFQ